MEEALGDVKIAPRPPVKQKLSARWTSRKENTAHHATNQAESVDCPGEEVYKNILDATLCRIVEPELLICFIKFLTISS